MKDGIEPQGWKEQEAEMAKVTYTDEYGTEFTLGHLVFVGNFEMSTDLERAYDRARELAEDGKKASVFNVLLDLDNIPLGLTYEAAINVTTAIPERIE